MTTDALWYELRNAVFSRDFGHAEELLAANPGLFDLTNSIGETVLHFLAVENDIEGVSWLHSQGFSLNTANRFHTPMLFEVASLGCKEMLLWLAQHGANFSIVDLKGRHILQYLLRRRHDAVRQQRYEEIVRFLIENVPDVAKISY
jgi:hypothetical protein